MYNVYSIMYYGVVVCLMVCITTTLVISIHDILQFCLYVQHVYLSFLGLLEGQYKLGQFLLLSYLLSLLDEK